VDGGRFPKRGEFVTEGELDGTRAIVSRIEEELAEEEEWSLAHSGRARLEVCTLSLPILFSASFFPFD
jgi:hypothetical protein